MDKDKGYDPGPYNRIHHILELRTPNDIEASNTRGFKKEKKTSYRQNKKKVDEDGFGHCYLR
jgi:hypothetical protein